MTRRPGAGPVAPDGHSFLAEYETGPVLGAVRRIAGLHHGPDVAADAWRRIFAFFGGHLHNGSTA